jgi:hypothetical protein
VPAARQGASAPVGGRAERCRRGPNRRQSTPTTRSTRSGMATPAEWWWRNGPLPRAACAAAFACLSSRKPADLCRSASRSPRLAAVQCSPPAHRGDGGRRISARVLSAAGSTGQRGGCCCRTAARTPLNLLALAGQCVAKVFKKQSIDKSKAAYFDEAFTQMAAECFAQDFNR